MPAWSVDGQDSAFLAASRMATLSPHVVSDILEELSLEPGMRVLDVGCGSGEYAFRLGSQLQGVSFTGVDYDQGFVEFAKRRARGEIGEPYAPVPMENTYMFTQGDGLSLPFEAGSFDAVVSHTYLTAVPDYMVALAEMCRVCKPGGWVSSVTVMGNDFGGAGRMQLLGPLVDPADAPLVNRVADLTAAYGRSVALTEGVPPQKAPVSFAWMGLEGVSVRPLAQYFCLSDAKTTSEDYRRYVELLYRTELNSAKRVRALAPEGSLSDAQWAKYADILRRRRAQLLEMRGSNIEWDWFGSAALLVKGRVPARGLFENIETLHDQEKEAKQWRASAQAIGMSVKESFQQLGPGRAGKVRLETSDGCVAEGCGLYPSQSAVVAYATLLGKLSSVGVNSVRPVSLDDVAGLEKMDPGAIYGVELLWETVYEAAQRGYALSFYRGESAGEGRTVFALREGVGEPCAFCVEANEEDLGIQLACAYSLQGI